MRVVLISDVSIERSQNVGDSRCLFITQPINVPIDFIMARDVTQENGSPQALDRVDNVFKAVDVTNIVQVTGRVEHDGVADDVSPSNRTVTQVQTVDHRNDRIHRVSVIATKGLVGEFNASHIRLRDDDQAEDFLTVTSGREFEQFAEGIVSALNEREIGREVLYYHRLCEEATIGGSNTSHSTSRKLMLLANHQIVRIEAGAIQGIAVNRGRSCHSLFSLKRGPEGPRYGLNNSDTVDDVFEVGHSRG